MPKILMLHGINHNMFGYREASLYGSASYEQINEAMTETARELGVAIEIYQTNYEGAFVEKIQQAFWDKTDAVIVNPGGWTKYTFGVADALGILQTNHVPLIEVHMSNTFAKHNGEVTGHTSTKASGIIIGMGVLSYTLAVRAAYEMIMQKK